MGGTTCFNQLHAQPNNATSLPTHPTRFTAVLAVAGRAEALGWQTVDVTASPLPGPQGNVEFFLWMRAGVGGNTVEGAAELTPLRDDALSAAIAHAIKEGPQ